MLNEVRNIRGAGLISWAPQCDIRNCGLSAIRLAVLRLQEPARWAPYFAGLMGDDAKRLGHAAAKFTAALRATIGPDDERRFDELGDALDDAGFFDEPASVQAVLGAEIGHVLVGMLIHATKTFTMVGEELPYREALDALLAAAPQQADGIGGAP